MEMIFNTAAFIFIFVFVFNLTASRGHVIKLDENSSIMLQDSGETAPLAYNERPVRHFAEHHLCRHKKGQMFFYHVMKTKLCTVKDMFVEFLVTDICTKNENGHYQEDLLSWVGEIFDSNGDGFISYSEEQEYSNIIDDINLEYKEANN